MIKQLFFSKLRTNVQVLHECANLVRLDGLAGGIEI